MARRGAGHGRNPVTYLFNRHPRSGAPARRLAGAFRRSELVSLDVADVAFNSDGLVVQLYRSKTDQVGQSIATATREHSG
jgi:hypothetical protein